MERENRKPDGREVQDGENKPETNNLKEINETVSGEDRIEEKKTERKFHEPLGHKKYRSHSNHSSADNHPKTDTGPGTV